MHLELRGNTGQVLDGEADLSLEFVERFTQFPAFRPEAELSDVMAAISLLGKAANPIIVAGGGAVSSDAAEEIVKLAESLAIPVATSLRARAVIRDDHPFSVGVAGTYSRWCANRAAAGVLAEGGEPLRAGLLDRKRIDAEFGHAANVARAHLQGTRFACYILPR